MAPSGVLGDESGSAAGDVSPKAHSSSQLARASTAIALCLTSASRYHSPLLLLAGSSMSDHGHGMLLESPRRRIGVTCLCHDAALHDGSARAERHGAAEPQSAQAPGRRVARLHHHAQLHLPRVGVPAAALGHQQGHRQGVHRGRFNDGGERRTAAGHSSVRRGQRRGPHVRRRAGDAHVRSPARRRLHGHCARARRRLLRPREAVSRAALRADRAADARGRLRGLFPRAGACGRARPSRRRRERGRDARPRPDLRRRLRGRPAQMRRDVCARRPRVERGGRERELGPRTRSDDDVLRAGERLHRRRAQGGKGDEPRRGGGRRRAGALWRGKPVLP
mmetsp:Transcript_11567/g.37874  ORF Transcript_11567/g.37874 Transcript_11567/m.37874 type:complete len:336 (+) Transcript_11567:694-1701(+)